MSYPDPSNVRSGVAFGEFDELTGTMQLPDSSLVIAGTEYGAAGPEAIGAYVEATPAQVRSGVSYGSFGTQFTGNCVVPIPSTVSNEVAGYGANGEEFVGLIALPTIEQVQSGVGYGAFSDGVGFAFTGTLSTPNVPAIIDVRSGVEYGAYDGESSYEFTGTLEVPNAGSVLDGVAVDASTGSLVLPNVVNVRSSITYGAFGNAWTGTCSVPAAANVLSGVAVSNTTGTYQTATESQVQAGVSFGAGGVLTGTLEAEGGDIVRRSRGRMGL